MRGMIARTGQRGDRKERKEMGRQRMAGQRRTNDSGYLSAQNKMYFSENLTSIMLFSDKDDSHYIQR
jgi:hypothetical protein